MNKKVILFLIIIVSLCKFSFAFADVAINEISYDLDGGDIDYVEVLNVDSDDVDLSTLKLFVNNSTSNHSINNSSGSSILHHGEYGVIVQSSEITTYTEKFGTAGNIFTSSFSLSNDAGKVEINDGDKNTPMSSVVYTASQGASGDGNSLQLLSGVWTAAAPTPGRVNGSSSSSAGATDTSSNNSASSTQTIEKSKTVQAKITTKISAKNNGFAGLPIEFSASTLGYSNKMIVYGKYFFNFGDGDSKEMKASDFQKFTHTYFYPGEYTVSLEYYTNYYTEYTQIPNATDSLTIKIVPAEIAISSVGDEKDFFVELSNNSSYDVDISKWILQSDTKSFILPRNTILRSKNKMMVSSKITSFEKLDASSLKLLSASWEPVFDYGTSLKPKQNQKEPHAISASAHKIENVEIPPADVISPQALTSTAINTGISETSNNSIVIISILALLLIASATMVYFLRKKGSSIQNPEGSDFEILAE